MKRVIVSGYFSPLGAGHIDILENARAAGDFLIVILNNDKQQLLRKGKIVLDESERQRVMGAVKYVDEVVMSLDEELTVEKTLEQLAKRYSEDKLVFMNGGSRTSETDVPEKAVCQKYDIELVFDTDN